MRFEMRPVYTRAERTGLWLLFKLKLKILNYVCFTRDHLTTAKQCSWGERILGQQWLVISVCPGHLCPQIYPPKTLQSSGFRIDHTTVTEFCERNELGEHMTNDKLYIEWWAMVYKNWPIFAQCNVRTNSHSCYRSIDEGKYYSNFLKRYSP